MLERIDHLMSQGVSFAFETTLATRSYLGLIARAQAAGYQVVLLFFYLESTSLAEARVELRVKQGGHNIPKDVIRRRYNGGLRNLVELFMNKVNLWYIFDNSTEQANIIAEGILKEAKKIIHDDEKWKTIIEKSNDERRK